MKAVAYYRVSTAKQGQSGLGLEAQQHSVQTFCASRGWEIIADFVEVESGKNNDRPQLQAALHRAKVTGATLVVAKLDRLGRNLAFLAALMASRVKLIFADMPEANEMTLGILAVLAQYEANLISERTKAALAAKKAHGVKLGNPNGAAALLKAGKGNAASIAKVKADTAAHAHDLAPIIADIREQGHRTLRAITSELNARHIQTRRGGRWHNSTVRNLLQRIPA